MITNKIIVDINVGKLVDSQGSIGMSAEYGSIVIDKKDFIPW